jgi:hypothetical protein
VFFDTLTYRNVIVSNRDENCKYRHGRLNAAHQPDPSAKKPPQNWAGREQSWPPAAPNELTRIGASLLVLTGNEKEGSEAAGTDALRADPGREREKDHSRKTLPENTHRTQQRGGRANGEKNRAVQHATQFSVLDRPLSGF